jgi:hypothetical protein
MLWHFYLLKNTAYIPAVAQTEAGFYLDIDPVTVVAATDFQVLKNAIAKTISESNPVIATPSRAEFSKPVVLRYSKVKSWAAFERGAMQWTIIEKDGIYQIKPGRKSPDQGWEDDPAREETLPITTSLDEIAQRVASLMQLALRYT